MEKGSSSILFTSENEGTCEGKKFWVYSSISVLVLAKEKAISVFAYRKLFADSFFSSFFSTGDPLGNLR